MFSQLLPQGLDFHVCWDRLPRSASERRGNNFHNFKTFSLKATALTVLYVPYFHVSGLPFKMHIALHSNGRGHAQCHAVPHGTGVPRS